MTEQELDNLWELFKEFCKETHATSSSHRLAQDFMGWLERRFNKKYAV